MVGCQWISECEENGFITARRISVEKVWVALSWLGCLQSWVTPKPGILQGYPDIQSGSPNRPF